jgi:hypothetical protein
MSSTFTDVMWCNITDALSFVFSFPSIPEFHRVVPLLLTCSSYEFVYTCFCIYVYLLDLSRMREKHVASVLLSLAYFT